MEQNEKAQAVLRALADAGPVTAHEFATARDAYINSWAPTFTHLRRAGLVKRTGERRLTAHGAHAYVIGITDAGRAVIV